ncbi:MAG: hypothetical protein GY796_09050 [Chloroflexi bacterium]|nr:hypothetical protein [Chloroflexota bacterium]
MRHHKLHRYGFITLILFILLNIGLVLLHITGQLDLRQFPQGRLALLALLANGTAVGGLRWRYRKLQQQLNEAANSQGLLLSLAPHPDTPLETHDLFRRFPAQYVPRKGDWPCAHTAFELTGNQFQMRYACFLSERQWRQAAVKEIAHEWHGTQIQAVPMTPEAAAADLIRAAMIEGHPAIAWCTLQLKEDDVYPLHIPDEPTRYGVRSRDQAETFLAAVNTTAGGIHAGVQMLVRPAPAAIAGQWAGHTRRLEGKLNQRGTRSRRSENGLAVTSQSYGPHNESQLRREVDAIAPRLGEVKVEVCMRIWAAGENQAQCEREVQRIAQNIAAETRSEDNKLIMAEHGRNWTPVLGRHFPPKGGFILTAGELGHLYHMPDKETMALYPKLQLSAANVRGPAADVILSPEQVPAHIRPGSKHGPPTRVYGTFDLPSGDTLYIGQPLSATTTHSLTTGSNGTGKSVAAANMALQDWCGGNAVLVIDPHGALLEDILSAVPPEREQDVTVLDMESSQPFQFNICRVGRTEGVEKTIGYLMEAIRIGEPASWDSAVGMKEVLENALMIALHTDEHASLTDVASVLDPATRMGLIDKVTAVTPEAQEAVHFWLKVFPSWNKNEQKRALTAAQRRINKFLKSRALRRTLASGETTFDLTAAIRQRKLILAPMPKSMGAETKRVWSALLVREFLSVLMTLPQADRQYTTLIIDELKDTIGTLAEFVKTIVEQLRKYNASGNFFAQSFNQLPEDVLLVLKNECRTQICFNCGPDNAVIAADMMGEGITARDIQKLPPYHAFVKLALPGAQASPCLIAMLPPLQSEPSPVANGRRKPTPPATILKPVPPGLAPAHHSAAELLHWLEIGGEANREAVMAHLYTLSLDDLASVWQKKQQLEQWKRNQLLHSPWIVPNKVKRIKTLSAATIGIPWWLSDYAYAHKRVQVTLPPNRKRDGGQKLYR